MKQVQISEELFAMLLRYHLCGEVDWQEEIETALDAKLQAIINRNLYTQYMVAPSLEQRETARQAYLDRKGVWESFRW